MTEIRFEPFVHLAELGPDRALIAWGGFWFHRDDPAGRWDIVDDSELGDVGDAVRALKAEDGGELQVHGSAGLIQTLLAEDLVDELRLIVFPVTVGDGKRLFGEGSSPRTWRLTTQRVSSTGAIMATYERVGDLETGNFVPE